jgi:hypothetical protein
MLYFQSWFDSHFFQLSSHSMTCHFHLNICAFCQPTYHSHQNHLESTFGFEPNSAIQYFQILTFWFRCFLNHSDYFRQHDYDFFGLAYWLNFNWYEFRAVSKFLDCSGQFDIFVVMGSKGIDWQKFVGAANFQVIYCFFEGPNPNLSIDFQAPIKILWSGLFFYLRETLPGSLGVLFLWAFNLLQLI